MEIRIKRAYSEPSDDDGLRVLVDRLWPRGLTKDAAAVELWLKDLAPSANLRKWFGHRPERFGPFAMQYRHELTAAEAQAAASQLRRSAAGRPITLVYAAKNTRCNHAVVLQAMLAEVFDRVP